MQVECRGRGSQTPAPFCFRPLLPITIAPMDTLTGITIRLAPQIEAKVAEAAERWGGVAEVAWWALAAVGAAAAVYIVRSLGGNRP